MLVVPFYLGLWATCIEGPKGHALHLSHFDSFQHKQAFVYLENECGAKVLRPKAAVIVTWNYIEYAGKIYETLGSERLAVMDARLAKDYKLAETCSLDDWMIARKSCFKDVTELPEFNETLEAKGMRIRTWNVNHGGITINKGDLHFNWPRK